MAFTQLVFLFVQMTPTQARTFFTHKINVAFTLIIYCVIQILFVRTLSGRAINFRGLLGLKATCPRSQYNNFRRRRMEILNVLTFSRLLIAVQMFTMHP